MPRGSLSRRYLSGSAWTTLGVGFSQAATFATAILAARQLGSATFGEYGIIQATTSAMGLLAGMGLALTAARFVGELRDRNPARCGEIVGLATVLSVMSGGLFALVLLVTAQWIATVSFRAPHLADPIRIAAFALFFNTVNGVQQGTLAGLERFRILTVLNLLRAVMTGIFVPSGLWLGGLEGMLSGLAAVALVGLIAGGSFQRQACASEGIPLRYWISDTDVSFLWRFTTPGFIALMIPGLVFWIVRSLLVQRPDGYEALGIFTAADQWTLVLVLVAGSMNHTSLPILSNTYAAGEWLRFRQLVIGHMMFPLLGTGLMALTVAILAEPLSSLYGPGFQSMAPVLELIAFIAVLRVLGGVTGNIMAALDTMWPGVLFNILWGATLIVAALLFVQWGALGLAWAYLIAYLLHSTWCSAYLVWKLRALRRAWATSGRH